METVRITVRFPLHLVNAIDALTGIGAYTTRSEVVRHALVDFIDKHSEEIKQMVEKIRKVQEIKAAVSEVEEYVKK